MEAYDESLSDQLEQMAQVFRDQLVACLEECVLGRPGLFSAPVSAEGSWLEAEQLRALALGLQQLFAQHERDNPLADEFLDLCTIHGESNPGEPRLARAFLNRIENSEVGSPLEGDRQPW